MPEASQGLACNANGGNSAFKHLIETKRLHLSSWLVIAWIGRNVEALIGYCLHRLSCNKAPIGRWWLHTGDGWLMHNYIYLNHNLVLKCYYHYALKFCLCTRKYTHGKQVVLFSFNPKKKTDIPSSLVGTHKLSVSACANLALISITGKLLKIYFLINPATTYLLLWKWTDGVAV